MKPSIHLALPLAVLLAVTACGESPEVLFAKAREDFAAENYQEARIALGSALGERPGNSEMLALLVETHLRLGDPDGAEGALRRLERAGGEGPAVARMKAQLALLRQAPQQALALIGADSSVDGWRIRAESQLALGEDMAARDAFEKGMAGGGDIRLASSYARYLLLNGDLTRAAYVLRRMQVLAPRSYEALVLAGDLAAAQGRDDAAIAAYRKVTEAFPGRVPPFLALANLQDTAGRVDEASALVEQAGKIAPDDPEVDELRFQLLSEKGEWEQIRDALQARESSLPPGSALSMTYGEALLRLNHPEQARVIFRRAVLLLPGNPYARLMLGEAQLATGDARRAWSTLGPLAATTLARPEVLERAEKAARMVGAPEAAELQVRLDPARLKATMALIDQGEGAMAGQDWNTAVSVYTRLLQRGGDPEVLRRLALANSRMGDSATAIAHADRALALDRDNADYLYMAGSVRVAAGKDLGEARRLLEAAALVDPRSRDIARELKKAKAAAR
ncbi:MULTISPECIES: tetratricopeptide repeat protein [unclassified Novosphingobium]|uniref:tetratricopeptide repeat protein n=1 Tax=unclassified Novosphingobium TaxID=2644732 RepID=UPI00135BC587|nr:MULTISPECIES: tetratricopeptide repeat protein [unclassified Novosphingobium]